MKGTLKLAANLAPFSRLCDRFVPSGYTEECTFHEKLEKFAAIKGIDGIGIGLPCPVAGNAA